MSVTVQYVPAAAGAVLHSIREEDGDVLLCEDGTPLLDEAARLASGGISLAVPSRRTGETSVRHLAHTGTSTTQEVP